MPEPSWETGKAWAHGYLKFLDFQSSGFDLHVTFPTKASIHVSVYSVGSKTDEKLAMQTMTVGVTGLVLETSKRLLVKNTVSPNAPISDEYWAFLEDRCTKKATELGILAPQQQVATSTTSVLTPVVQKGGNSGIPVTSTWGDANKKKMFNSAFPTLSGKNG